MIAKKAKIDWIGFGIINSKFSFIPFDDTGEKFKNSNIQDHPMDVDFAHSPSEDGSFQVDVKIKINPSLEPGYTIKLHAVGLFKVDNDVEKKEERDHLFFFSATNLMIGRMREVMSTQTLHGFFGSYTLQSIDINYLFKQKASLNNADKN